MVVVIVKETAKGTIRIMIVIKVMEVIATEWNAALIRVANVPIKATMVEVATKATMANETTTRAVPTDHLATEETHRMRQEATVVDTVVAHPEELLEDHLEEVVVITKAETQRTLKNKEEDSGGQTRIVPSYFVLK
jgi:hypothetical protein